MLFEHALLLIGIPLILIILGVTKKYGAMLIAGGTTLAVVGVLVLASPVTIQTLDNTTDASYYWMCDQPIASCVGDGWNANCSGFNQTECEAIGGCAWGGAACSGSATWDCEYIGWFGGQTTCNKAKTCRWANFTISDCDSINVTYNYSLTEPPANDNLIFGILLTFVGLISLIAGAIDIKT